MVEINNIIPVLSKSFREISRLNDNLIRCAQSYQQRPIAYFYFDTSENFLKSDFNINEYQDQYIAKDYYQVSGWIQWNFYLIFVFDINCGASSSQIASSREGIEKNKDFTRKYIIPFEQIAEWVDITAAAPNRLTVPLISSNIAARWIEKIDQVGLNAINSTSGCETVVHDYLEENRSSKPITRAIKPGRKLNHTLERLSYLEIQEFRQKKACKFPIGAVTLLAGANGAGKTSFIEGHL